MALPSLRAILRKSGSENLVRGTARMNGFRRLMGVCTCRRCSSTHTLRLPTGTKCLNCGQFEEVTKE